ncbi:alpha/beta fold hydrolase [Domibacillus tundrae]|uniref:alpha/beta fold hydrolase n=1 Tax=Domibacillus tundrae TaxID=1587527 RepID=UPI000617E878|nr:alpha/beta hydrolase [Domibacillus tundrae]
MQVYTKELGDKQIQIADYPGEKGTVIAIHGLTGTHKNMNYYAEALKGDYRFIAIDLRGRGNSSQADEHTSIYRHAEDIIHLIEAMNIENPILLGHSMGAFISMIVASQLKSVRAVVLLDGAASMSDQQRDIVKPSLGRLSKQFDSKESYLDEVKGIYQRLGIEWTLTLQEAVEYEIHPAGSHWEHKSDEQKILEDFESFYSFNPEEICSKVECPTLLVYAKGKIGAFPPLFFEEAYDATKIHTRHLQKMISDSNHYTMVFEERKDINQAIKTFLDTI